ncbi:hypothetical protein PHJA_001953100 [Phtheirospermum japonicum]|uniref:Uncharacterized protein n=1 Tax=Phtheirospermum japonicum TaxID=374723 RepID=A0A830CEQ3_9LAMI|nr:hypothetical protein PHJA_001953100 [Phtheirospermum japonicum]
MVLKLQLSLNRSSGRLSRLTMISRSSARCPSLQFLMMEEYGRRECHQGYKGGPICHRLCRQSKPRASQENSVLITELFCHLSVPRKIIS